MKNILFMFFSTLFSVTFVLIILYGFRFQLASMIAGDTFSSPIVAPAPVAPESNHHLIPDIIERVDGAVVSVAATKDVPVYERYLEKFNPFGDWFGGFTIPQLRENGTEEREVGGGTGFIVSPEGLIVTNRHVVDVEGASYSVVFADGSAYPVTVKAKDEVLDIAILEFAEKPAIDLPYIPFGDSNRVRRGETVIVIGNALAEFDNSVSVGIISGIGRSITASDGMGQSEQLSNVFQTDAAINPGNSGGPLLNLEGEVIGVNVAASLGAENIGFAIPADSVQQIVDSVKMFGEIRRPFLGVRYVMITKRTAEKNNLGVTHGALIARGETIEDLAVMPGSPADIAGLRENDVILAIDGVSLAGTDLATVLRSKPVDATIEVTIWRQGREETLSVPLTAASSR